MAAVDTAAVDTAVADTAVVDTAVVDTVAGKAVEQQPSSRCCCYCYCCSRQPRHCPALTLELSP